MSDPPSRSRLDRLRKRIHRLSLRSRSASPATSATLATPAIPAIPETQAPTARPIAEDLASDSAGRAEHTLNPVPSDPPPAATPTTLFGDEVSSGPTGILTHSPGHSAPPARPLGNVFASGSTSQVEPTVIPGSSYPPPTATPLTLVGHELAGGPTGLSPPSAAPPAITVGDSLAGSSSTFPAPSQAAPATSVSDGLASGSATANTAPSDPPSTATPKQISMDDVLAELKSKQKYAITKYCNQNASQASDAIQEALTEAKKQKEFYEANRWKVTFGTKTIYLREKADTIIDLLSKFKDFGTALTRLDPIHAGLPWAGVCVLLQISVGGKEQRDALLSGVVVALSTQQAANLYADMYNTHPAGPAADELRRSLVKLYGIVLGFLAEALHLQASEWARFMNSLLNNDDLKKFPAQCNDGLEAVGRAASHCDRQLSAQNAALVADTTEHVADILGQLDDLRAEAARTRITIDLTKLPIARGAQHDSYHQPELPTCLKGTRVDLLEDIARWADDSKGETFFWLQGNAGEGKSTIAKTVAATLQDQLKLGASFFFQRDDADRGSARLLFSTIAAQLAQSIDGLKAAIAKVLDFETNRYDKNMQCQFEDLIAAPLREIAQSSASTSIALVIVIDALDECYDGDIVQVIQLLTRAGSFGIRTCITSRPDVLVGPARTSLERAQYQKVVLENYTHDTIEHDISLFFTQQFERLRSDNPTLAVDWPGQHRVTELIRRSVPLFIFAATVCRFVSEPGYTPEELLQTVLDEPSRLPLTRTYRPVLERWLAVKTKAQSKEAAIAEFRKIVGPVLFSAVPLPVTLVARLSELAIDKLEARLGLLHSVLQTNKLDGEAIYTIKAFHLSFQDFVVQSEDALDFRIDKQQTHKSMAAACLALMMEADRLRQDICAVSKPGTTRIEVDPNVVDSHIEPYLAYACQHWVYHQVQSGEKIDESHAVYHFLTRYFLFWFEAMAWLGKASEVLHMVKRLKSLTNVDCSTRLLEFLEDAYYFVREYSYIADLAPLQIYASALVFAPECSLVKASFKHCWPRWLVLPPKVNEKWDVDRITLKGHKSHITAMAFSPDETHFATYSIDDSIRIWEPTTGECITTLQVSHGLIHRRAMSFSGDNRRLAVGLITSLPNASPMSERSETHMYYVIVYDIKAGIKVRESRRTTVGGRKGFPNLPADARSSWPNISVAFMPDHDNMLHVATLGEHMLETWVLDIASDSSRQVWSADVFNPQERATLSCTGLTISTDRSLVSCGLNPEESIATWHLESGALVSKHDAWQYRYTGGFLAFCEEGVLYDSRIYTKSGMTIVWLKLNIKSGQVREIARIRTLGGQPGPATSAIAYERAILALAADYPQNAELVQMHSLSQATDMDTDAHTQSSLEAAYPTADGETICLRYSDHVELQDIRGSVMFRSNSNLNSVGSTHIGVSSDGSVVILATNKMTHVYYVGTERVLLLPGFHHWGQPPVFSSDKRFVAIVDDCHIIVWDLGLHKELRSIDLLQYNTKDDIPLEICMFFSENNGMLFTDIGCIDLGTGEWNTDVIGEQGGPFRLGWGESWVHYNGEDLLWLPQQYRPGSLRSAGAKHTVACRRKNGSLMTMRFTEPE